MTSVAKSTIAPDVSLLVDGASIDAGDVLAAINDLDGYIEAGRVGITDADTHVKTLETAITVGTGLAKSVTTPGGDERLALALASALLNLYNLLPSSGKIQAAAIDSETANSAFVLTANGSGGAAWQAAGGGGALPVDITVTAGEALAERDVAYVDPATGTAFKVDVDASPIRMGRLRGVINEPGGIANGATGSMRILGEVAGYAGLTAWGPVYASATAGGITQTKPSPTAGGGGVALVEVGIAVSATNILVRQTAARYMRRAVLAAAGSLTVAHHGDVLPAARRVDAYVPVTVAGSEITGYASGNQNYYTQLRAVGGAGGTTTVDSAGATTSVIGTAGGVATWQAQSFRVTAGYLSQFTFNLAANTGTPSGTITWELRADSAGKPLGEVLQTGTFTPVASSNNTVGVTNGVFLKAATTYWVVLRPTSTQANGNHWNINRTTTSSYADGENLADTGAADTWTAIASPTGRDLRMTATTAAAAQRDKLAQSFTLAGTETVGGARVYLRRVGSPTGTITVRIETNNAGAPSGTLVDAAATATISEAGLGTGFDFADVLFTGFSLGAGTYWLVISTDRSASNTNYVEWGLASGGGFSGGLMRREVSSTWADEGTADAIFSIAEEGVTYGSRIWLDWSGSGSATILNRYDDGAGADPSTKTTYINNSGVSREIVAVVEMD